ncbi:MAG: prepilin peptidase, partial [Actinomycetota bacterium]|nr:prepilin peptidase [Actinomycetota bacterium]
MRAFEVVIAALFGLIVGSFLNVVIYRVPRGESIVAPPSSCPRCGHRLSAWENVPVISFLILHGRCRSCRERISWRYPLVELLGGIAFAAIAARYS